MKTLSPELQAHLESGATTLAWCWRVARRDGAVFGFTDHDRPLVFEDVTHAPDSGFAASELRAGSDLAVDAQEAEGVLNAETIAEADVVDGLWDHAAVQVWRVNWQDPSQRVLMRSGHLGQLRRGRAAFVVEVRSLSHALSQTVGRTSQHACDAALGDARCGIDLENPAFRGAGVVASVVPDRGFDASGLDGFAAGWFAHGTLSWTSGANAGRSAEVESHALSGGVVAITLAAAPVRTIEAGDGFEIRAGCDKRLATCRDKFANVINFRGFPHIPGQDAVIRYAGRGEGNGGEAI